ncbi:MAG TPA: TetR/AcrR family transcriptional regulator [Acidimicrobiia bacterium]|nr:TetR/AcrR family transcriptional regulator [Acidimicrobiia bacterium]
MPAARTATKNGRKATVTRERILDAAAKVLAERGYAGTRLGEIADVAGIQPPAIYYHFESREALMEEVIRLGTRKTREHVERVLADLRPDLSALERLDAALEAHLRCVLDLSDYAKAAIRNAGQVPADMRARQFQDEKAYGAVWRKLFNDAARSGEIPGTIDVRAARMLIVGALNNTPEWWDPSVTSLDKLIATTHAIVRSGLSA